MAVNRGGRRENLKEKSQGLRNPEIIKPQGSLKLLGFT